MTTDELTDTFDGLYSYMSASNEPRNMKLFGSVMREMMAWTIRNQPSAAEMWIDKLGAIRWSQYLSKGEANAIIERMKPGAVWDYDTWQNAMTKLALETERKGIFNEYALWVWMNALYSDYSETLSKYVFDEPIADVDAAKVVPLIHAMAVANLTDADGNFSIRDYFRV